MVEFWKENLNPITMFTSPLLHTKKTAQQKKGSWLKKEDLEPFACARKLRKEFGIGAQRLKELFSLIGVEPRFNVGNTYYPKESVEKARQLLAERNEPKIVDMSGYISNKDLMEMFGFNTFKAFYIADKEKLEKKRFSGNVNYYEKEKATTVFSKYKK